MSASVATTNPVLELAQALIRRESNTPQDAGCQELMAQRLAPLGFTLEQMPFSDVQNLWAVWGTGPKLCVLAGHTDVVPTGPLEEWEHPPFSAHTDEHWLHGRGSADMKVSLAAMVVACENLFGPKAENPLDPAAGRIAFLITSDEEGPAQHGTKAVMAELQNRNLIPDYCIVGEPSSSEKLGDVVRNGRRGSLNGELVVRGVQGHVAYPESVINPITSAMSALAELSATRWDEGNQYYPPTSFQISNINSGTGATNVVPGELSVVFNFRYCTEQTADSIQQKVQQILATHFDKQRSSKTTMSADALSYEVHWALSGEPFLTPIGPLTDAVTAAITRVTGSAPELSTSGGTSDGRFIGPLGTAVVEVGPINATIHKLNERVALNDLEPLAAIYEHTLRHLFTQPQ